MCERPLSHRVYCSWPLVLSDTVWFLSPSRSLVNMHQHKFRSRRLLAGKINSAETSLVPFSTFWKDSGNASLIDSWSTLPWGCVCVCGGQLGLLTQHVWWSLLLAHHSSVLGYSCGTAVMKLEEDIGRKWPVSSVQLEGLGLGWSDSCFWGTETQNHILNEIHQADDKLNLLISVDTRRWQISASALSWTEAPHLPLHGGSDDTIRWVWSDSVRAP